MLAAICEFHAVTAKMPLSRPVTIHLNSENLTRYGFDLHTAAVSWVKFEGVGTAAIPEATVIY
jgi:hypothetical protein